VWGSQHSITSSFGWQGVGKQFGIASTRDQKLVAFRTTVKEGEGQDCALILVCRLLVPPARRSPGADKDRVIICILGHSGAGTFAGAQVATAPRLAAGLYPPQRSVSHMRVAPHMRVVSATYTRAPSTSLRDNRVVTGAYLVDEELSPSPVSNDSATRRAPSKRKKSSRMPPAERNAFFNAPARVRAGRRA
jgi:hypothetical protein